MTALRIIKGVALGVGYAWFWLALGRYLPGLFHVPVLLLGWFLWRFPWFILGLAYASFCVFWRMPALYWIVFHGVVMGICCVLFFALWNLRWRLLPVNLAIFSMITCAPKLFGSVYSLGVWYWLGLVCIGGVSMFVVTFGITSLCEDIADRRSQERLNKWEADRRHFANVKFAKNTAKSLSDYE